MTTSTPDAGALVATVGDTSVRVRMIGGGSWELPVGVTALLDGPLSDPPSGRPRPEQLTNALGVVHDHFDDVVIESPIVAAAPSLTVMGDHAVMLARVEIGRDDVDLPATLERRDVDEVFRTLVSESRDERADNPGLDAGHADSIVATCCIVLAIVRRLDLLQVTVAAADVGGAG